MTNMRKSDPLRESLNAIIGPPVDEETGAPEPWVTDTQRSAATGLMEPLTQRERLLVAEAALAGFTVGNFMPSLSDATFPDDQEIVLTVLAAVAAWGTEYFPSLNEG